MDRVRERVSSGRPLPTVDPNRNYTTEDLRAMTHDERVALLQATAIADPDRLPDDIRVEIDEDVRRAADGLIPSPP
jgi:hypothetical protein